MGISERGKTREIPGRGEITGFSIGILLLYMQAYFSYFCGD